MKRINRNEKHKKYIKLLNSKQWRELREWKINHNPLCERCAEKGLVVSAVDIHHIRPVESVPEDQMESVCFNPQNLIALCVPCHIETHRQMRSHEGQMKKDMPKEEPNTDNHIKEWAARHGDLNYQPPPKPRKGIRKTRFGWITMEEYKQKQREELEAWVKELNKRVDGYKDINGTPTVDVKSED